MKQSRASLYKKIKPLYRCLICETDVFVENKQGTCPNCVPKLNKSKVSKTKRVEIQKELEYLYIALLPENCRICIYQDNVQQKCLKHEKFYEDCDDFDHGIGVV